MNILHIVNEVSCNNGLQTFLELLINNTTSIFKHTIAVFKNGIKENKIDKTIKIIELNSLNEIKQIKENYKIDLIIIHWIGARSFDGTGFIGIYTDPRGIKREFINTNGNEVTIDNHPYGYINIFNLFSFYELKGSKVQTIEVNGTQKKCLLKDRPIIIVISHTDYKLPQNIGYPFTSKIISVSKKTSLKNLAVKTNHEVIYNGIQPLEFKIEIKEKNKYKVGWLGRLNKYNYNVYSKIKDDEYLNSHCDFYYAGAGSLDNNPLDNHMFFGEISKDKVIDFLKNIDILLYPSMMDSFGIVIIEAMNLGIPIIASKEVAEIVSDCGYVCDKDIEFIHRLKTLINDVKTMEIFQKNCIIKIRELFSIETMIKSYIKSFQEVINEERNKGFI